MSTDAHADALKAYLSAAAGVPVLDLDEIQALTSLPRNYVEFYLERRFGGTVRLAGRRANRLRRLSTRVVAYQSVTNARVFEDRIAEAFQSPVDLGDVTVHVNYETGGGSFELDDDYYTAMTDWTYST